MRFRSAFTPFLLFSAAAGAAFYQTSTPTLAEAPNTNHSVPNNSWPADTIYRFEALDIDGNNIPLSKYQGKVVIVVNVASAWGKTNLSYTQLQELYERYHDQGLEILAFPCNQFGSQEPGPNEKIKEFVKKFGVSFQMFSKIDVNGATAHPLFEFLQNAQEGFITNSIKWNFTKFIINRNGVPVSRHGTQTAPFDMEAEIVQLLAQK